MEAVQTREECEMAAAMLGLDFRKAESATDYPKGCYHLDIGNIEGSAGEAGFAVITQGCWMKIECQRGKE